MDYSLIVADAGGSTTEWWVLSPSMSHPLFVTTEGINAATGKAEAIRDSISIFRQKCLEKVTGKDFGSIFIYFYGAGCNSDYARNLLEMAFEETFADSMIRLKVHTDLQGAALALFGDEPGIACILGTGSASGIYDGRFITESIPSLGYILGDEGSGAFMGRMLLRDWFKKSLPSKIEKELEAFCGLRIQEVIEAVYRKPGANKFLASFVPFLASHSDCGEISEIIDNSLKLFFEFNVLKYNKPRGTQIGFVGGVASAFSDRIRTIGSGYGLATDRFIYRPIIALGEYFTNRFFV